jgi:hypothetical protein
MARGRDRATQDPQAGALPVEPGTPVESGASVEPGTPLEPGTPAEPGTPVEFGTPVGTGRRAVPWLWIFITLCFVAGFLCRLVVFTGRHLEGDEIVYTALVCQLQDGHGYTLMGTPLLKTGYPNNQYAQALFYHPPGGILIFWFLARLFGANGYPIAQVLSYAVFFWSMVFLARALFGPRQVPSVPVVTLLAAFTPIMTHVVSRYWLDGPMLAFAALSAALFVPAMQRQDARRAILAAVTMGLASWMKSSALMALPGVLLLGWMAAPPDTRRSTIRLALLFAGLSLLLQTPWQIWQWRVVHSPFPAWAGKPSAELVRRNRYVYGLTVLRPPWMYLTMLPRTVATILPAIGALVLVPMASRERWIGWALLAWIGVVLAAVVGLGAIGYSKLLRYAILVTPATVLLAGLAAGEAWRLRTATPPLPRGKTMAVVLLVLLAAGVVLEVSQGVFTPLMDRASDLIVPLLLPGNKLY